MKVLTSFGTSSMANPLTIKGIVQYNRCQTLQWKLVFTFNQNIFYLFVWENHLLLTKTLWSTHSVFVSDQLQRWSMWRWDLHRLSAIVFGLLSYQFLGSVLLWGWAHSTAQQYRTDTASESDSLCSASTRTAHTVIVRWETPGVGLRHRISLHQAIEQYASWMTTTDQLSDIRIS